MQHATEEMHRASQAGFEKITRLLLDRGAELEIADHKGHTPLFDAVYYGRTKAALMLLEHGANLAHQDNRGETPLFIAARRCHVGLFSALLAAGADSSQVNDKQKTVSELVRSAKTTPERTKIVAMLESRSTPNG